MYESVNFDPELHSWNHYHSQNNECFCLTDVLTSDICTEFQARIIREPTFPSTYDYIL